VKSTITSTEVSLAVRTLKTTTSPGVAEGEAPLQNFSPLWKNVLCIVENFWTYLKKLGLLSGNSSPTLVSQAGYGPAEDWKGYKLW